VARHLPPGIYLARHEGNDPSLRGLESQVRPFG